MIQQEVLPITFNSWLDTDIYYLLTKMMTGINSIDAVFQGDGAFHIYLDWREDNREDNIKLKYLINVDPKTYSKVRFLKPENQWGICPLSFCMGIHRELVENTEK